jgi:peroxiredoxin
MCPHRVLSRIGTAVLSAVLLCGCATSRSAPDFALQDIDGRTFALSQHSGKEIVLLDFWATWCEPCARELPHLEALSQRYKGQGLLVVGVAMDGPETVASVAPFTRRYGVTFPVVLDEDTRVASLYNPRRAAPFMVIIDRAGRVAKTREGYNMGDEKAIEEDVRELLTSPTPTGTDAAQAGP